MLLRHAADRGERARPRGPPPPPDRPAGAGGSGPAGSVVLPDPAAARTPVVVVQLPARPALDPGLAGMAVAAAPAPARRSAAAAAATTPVPPATRPDIAIGAAHVRIGARAIRRRSWGTVSRPDRVVGEPRADRERPGRAVGLDAGPRSGALAAIDPEAPRRDDEPPPFDPPRGSAYFRWVAEVGLQAADALAHAHHQGVIHRDVKPSNLLIDGKGNIWVTDFGLARRLADPGLTHHDSLLGTPRYMSPEQARTGPIDGRTDVYSLGATLYELLTLRPPFDGRSAAELIDQIGRDEPVPPRTIDPRMPRDLETIVLKTLAKRPADRYATAADLAEDLARFLNHEPVKARRISPVGRLWRVARRHPGITSVTTAAAAAILAIATFAYVRVVAERDEAILAKSEKEEAFLSREDAYRQTRAAMKELLLADRRSSSRRLEVPDRRSRGLELHPQGAWRWSSSPSPSSAPAPRRGREVPGAARR